jgi:RsiW-degrading membrane proteinase PrsW (M82 family)
MKHLLKLIIRVIFIILVLIALFLNKFWKFIALLAHFLWSLKINKNILESFKVHGIVIYIIFGFFEYKDINNIKNIFNYDSYEFEIPKSLR